VELKQKGLKAAKYYDAETIGQENNNNNIIK